MDLRSLPPGLTPFERVEERRARVERECGIDLGYLSMLPENVGSADEKNCEQMVGAVPVPVGYAGPLTVAFSSGDTQALHLPLATTEGALVASVNRGCKAIGTVKTHSIYHGVSRSIAFKDASSAHGALHRKAKWIRLASTEQEWKSVGESTSQHLKILSYDTDEEGDTLFLTIHADTDEAMGMNMVTIAAEAIGQWIAEHLDLPFVTVAGNVDSDKKPSRRTHDRGRGYEVTAEAVLDAAAIADVLKTTPDAMLRTAEAKLQHGSKIAGAIGSNLHAANVIAALYLATGQDAAHVVEGSLADTHITLLPMPKQDSQKLHVSTRIPALLVGVRGGGAELPAQRQCLTLLLGQTRASPAFFARGKSSLKPVTVPLSPLAQKSCRASK